LETIDASGLTVTPGFIDSHSHSDSNILTYPEQIEKIEQGITTSIGGQCGGSPAPYSGSREKAEQIGEFGLECDVYKDMSTFLSIAKTVPQGANSMVLVGHNSIRDAVMGNAFRAPTEEELERMKAYVRDAMEAGALGLSFGLGYNPGCYSEIPEMSALAKVAAEYGGVVTSHIRNEGDNVAAAVKEFLQVLRESGARGVVSHLKSSDREENWGKVHNLMRLIDEANAEGLDVYADVYPYNAYNTSLLPIFGTIEFRANSHDVMLEELKKPEVRAALRRRNGINYAEPLTERDGDSYAYVIESDPGVDVRRNVFAICAEQNWPLVGLEAIGDDLENIFIKLVDRSENGKTARKKNRNSES
jgi:N-acyl-D-amino-acid deacylase